MSLDNELRDLLSDTAQALRPAPGDLEAVIQRGRHHRRRRRMARLAGAGMGAALAALLVSLASTIGPTVTAEVPVATTQTTTAGGVPVVVPDGVPFSNAVQVDGSPGFMVLERPRQQANGFWQHLAVRLGLTPDLRVYSTETGAEWGVQSVDTDALADEDVIIAAADIDGTLTLVVGVAAADRESRLQDFRLVRTRDFEQWETVELGLPAPDVDLPDQLEWYAAPAAAALVDVDGAVGVKYYATPVVADPSAFLSYSWDVESGWVLVTTDHETIRFAPDQVPGDGLGTDRLMLGLVGDGAVDPITAIPLGPDEAITAVDHASGRWLVVLSGVQDELDHPVRLLAGDGTHWEEMNATTADGSALIGGRLYTFDVVEGGWRVTRWSSDGSTTVLGQPFGAEASLGLQAPWMPTGGGSLVATAQRSAWVYSAAEDRWIEHDLDFDGFERLPDWIGGESAGNAGLLTDASNELYPVDVVDGWLIGRRMSLPDRWWAFDVGD